MRFEGAEGRGMGIYESGAMRESVTPGEANTGFVTGENFQEGAGGSGLGVGQARATWHCCIGSCFWRGGKEVQNEAPNNLYSNIITLVPIMHRLSFTFVHRYQDDGVEPIQHQSYLQRSSYPRMYAVSSQRLQRIDTYII